MALTADGESFVIPKTRTVMKAYKKPDKGVTTKIDATPRRNTVTPSNSVIQLRAKAEILDINNHKDM